MNENREMISEQENNIEKQPNINELINEIQTKYGTLFKDNSEIDLDSLDALREITSEQIEEGLTEKDKIAHLESIIEEILALMPKDKQTEIRKTQKSSGNDLATSLLGLLMLLQSFSPTMAIADPKSTPKIERKQFSFTQLQEFQIDGKKFRFGIATDMHGEFGSYKQFIALDINGKNVFPEGESTWAHELDGFYIGNLLPGKEPEIMVWHRITDADREQMRGNFYQWSKQERKFVPYHSNLTDEKFAPDQKAETQKALLKKTRFTKSFETLRRFLENCKHGNLDEIKKFIDIPNNPQFSKNLEQTVENNLDIFKSFQPRIYEARIEGPGNSLSYFLETPQGNFLRIYSFDNKISIIEVKIK